MYKTGNIKCRGKENYGRTGHKPVGCILVSLAIYICSTVLVITVSPEADQLFLLAPKTYRERDMRQQMKVMTTKLEQVITNNTTDLRNQMHSNAHPTRQCVLNLHALQVTVLKLTCSGKTTNA